MQRIRAGLFELDFYSYTPSLISTEFSTWVSLVTSLTVAACLTFCTGGCGTVGMPLGAGVVPAVSLTAHMPCTCRACMTGAHMRTHEAASCRACACCSFGCLLGVHTAHVRHVHYWTVGVGCDMMLYQQHVSWAAHAACQLTDQHGCARTHAQSFLSRLRHTHVFILTISGVLPLVPLQTLVHAAYLLYLWLSTPFGISEGEVEHDASTVLVPFADMARVGQVMR